MRIFEKSADCNRNNKKNGWTHYIKRGSIAIIFSLAMMTLSGCSLYDIAGLFSGLGKGSDALYVNESNQMPSGEGKIRNVQKESIVQRCDVKR